LASPMRARESNMSGASAQDFQEPMIYSPCDLEMPLIFLRVPRGVRRNKEW
jgi:hypothetical protein